MLAALVVCAPLAWLEPQAMDWHVDLVAAMAWSVLVLTLGGSSLLYLLIQRGEATSVTSLLYLVPPCTALMAWALFGEAFTPPMMLGMALTVIGVAIVVRNPRAASLLAAPQEELYR
jgi:drug/metabolite transporter (DMT)-like permease